MNTSSEFPIGNIKIASNGFATSDICFAHQSNSKHPSSTHEQLKLIKSLDKREFKFKESIVTNHMSASIDEMFNTAEQQKASQVKHAAEADFIYELEGVQIEQNGSYSIDMWIKAPEYEGEHKFYFMFFYQECLSIEETGAINTQPQTIAKRKLSTSQNLKYRTIRYEFDLRTIPSVASSSSSLIPSAIDSSVLVNLELVNRHFQVHQNLKIFFKKIF